MSVKQKDVGSSLTLDHFFCACNFGFVRLFFANLFNVSKGSPLQFFDIVQQNGVQKIPKAWDFLNAILLYNIKKLKGGPFRDIKKICEKKSHKAEITCTKKWSRVRLEPTRVPLRVPPFKFFGTTQLTGDFKKNSKIFFNFYLVQVL